VHKIASEPVEPGAERRRERTAPDAYVEFWPEDLYDVMFPLHEIDVLSGLVSSCDGGASSHRTIVITL
jgi:hypothetical protein